MKVIKFRHDDLSFLSNNNLILYSLTASLEDGGHRRGELHHLMLFLEKMEATGKCLLHNTKR
jgi:hypothetical protein